MTKRRHHGGEQTSRQMNANRKRSLPDSSDKWARDLENSLGINRRRSDTPREESFLQPHSERSGSPRQRKLRVGRFVTVETLNPIFSIVPEVPGLGLRPRVS